MTQGEFFERYKYDVKNDKIGIGTYGSVYKAYDTVENRYVALKISEVKSTEDTEAETEVETGLTGDLPEHVNVLKYESVSTFRQSTGTFDFAVMPFLPSGNLTEILHQNLPDQKSRESIALQLLEGLEFIHNQGVIHRNLKPANILMEVNTTTEGTEFIPKISDSGLSKTSATGYKHRFTSHSDTETIQYRSPEQLKGEPIRFNTDLWSWAVISYKLLTGNELFTVDTASGELQVILKILEEDVTPKLSGLPENWRIALQDALIKDPSERIKSASGLRNILTGDFQEQIIPMDFENEAQEYEEVVPEEYEEVIPEEYEVAIEDEPTAIPPQQKTAQSASTASKKPAVTTVKKARSRKWLYIFPALLIFGVFYYILSGSNVFGHTLSEKKAESILTNMMEYRSNEQFERTSEVFAEKADKYFSENDVSRSNIIADMEKFAESWSFENTRIIDFGRTVENMFHFIMTYDLRDKKTLQITSYKVSGEVGFIRENEQYKINYIINRGVANSRNEFSYGNVISRKEQDFSDYMLTYNASVLYLPDVKDHFLLSYIYNGAFTQNPAGFSREQLQKAIQDDYIDFINFSENEKRNDLFDSLTNFSKQIEMSTAFVDADFLCVQVVQNIIKGMSGSGFSLSYRCVDYADGRILALNDVLNTNAVPWSDLIRKSMEREAVTAGNKTISAADISSLPEAPGNFYFDTKKMFFVYGADQIPEAAHFGPVTVSVPLKDLEKYLTTQFKTKILNSRKVNVKRI